MRKQVAYDNFVEPPIYSNIQQNFSPGIDTVTLDVESFRGTLFFCAEHLHLVKSQNKKNKTKRRKVLKQIAIDKNTVNTWYPLPFPYHPTMLTLIKQFVVT